MVRSMLSEILRAVISQTLMKKNGGGRIAALHGARRAPDRDDAGSAPHPYIVKPSQRQPKMLSEADGGVGGERKACDRKPVDACFRDFRGGDEPGHGAAEKPVRAPDRIADVRNRYRRRQHHIVVRARRHQAGPPR